MSMNKYKKTSNDNPFEDDPKTKERRDKQVESMMPVAQNKKACGDCTIF